MPAVGIDVIPLLTSKRSADRQHAPRRVVPPAVDPADTQLPRHDPSSVPGNVIIADVLPGREGVSSRDGVEAGSRDAGRVESGNRGAGSRDPGSRDPGSKDAGGRDAGSKDAGRVDPGSKDAGGRDRVDAGSRGGRRDGLQRGAENGVAVGGSVTEAGGEQSGMHPPPVAIPPLDFSALQRAQQQPQPPLQLLYRSTQVCGLERACVDVGVGVGIGGCRCVFLFVYYCVGVGVGVCLVIFDI